MDWAESPEWQYGEYGESLLDQGSSEVARLLESLRRVKVTGKVTSRQLVGITV